MDKRKSVLNITTSVVFKILIMVSSLIVRRCLIKNIGNEANGIDSLYTSILGFMAVAELGIGSAISFSMYKPIVEKDNETVAGLYRLYVKLYRVVGIIILLVGIVIVPFLPKLAADYDSININFYSTFLLMLVSTVLTYMYSAKSSLINAYKNNYVTTTINSSCILLRILMQIVIVNITKSMEWYYMCTLLCTIIDWAITDTIANKKYYSIIHTNSKLDKSFTKNVAMSIKAMFMHKIGGLLVNTADNIIISAYIGVIVLGRYTNYTVIATGATIIVNMVFSSLTSVIGHMCASSNDKTKESYFDLLYSLNYVIGIFVFVGYYSIAEAFVTLFYGEELVMERSIPFIIALNQFVQYIRQATLTFRAATGVFYYDRWKPLFEGITNVVLSVLFVKTFPAGYKVVGVIVATIITNLLICHVVEPIVLYNKLLHKSASGFVIKNYLYVATFMCALFVMDKVMVSMNNVYKELLANACISIIVSTIFCVLLVMLDKGFKGHICKCFDLIRKGVKRIINK